MTSWGYQNSTDPDYADQEKLLKFIQQRHCADCRVGPNGVTIGYPCSGEVLDHMYAKQGIKYSTLWEMYLGGEQDSDCVHRFNPTDDKYRDTVDVWANALLSVGEYVQTNVDPTEHSKPNASSS